MEIKLNENWYITKDAMCWQLRNEVATGRTSPKTGKEIVSSRVTYHNSLEQALNSFIDDAVTGDSLQELIQSLKQAREEVKHASVELLALGI